jgi:protein-L-isoaspartate(D-aspartate) O-methyltransferase
MSKLVNDLIRNGYLRSERVIDAFSEIGRIEFVPDEFRLQSDANVALPIGYGQMIPDPLVASIAFELLEPYEGCKILCVNSGLGWTAALSAYIAGESGAVVALEKNIALEKTSKFNADKYGYIKKGVVKFFLRKQEIEKAEYENYFPVDRVLIFNEKEISVEEFKKFLKIGGKMVNSTDGNLTYIEKKSEDEFYAEKYPGFSLASMFVE